MLIRTATIDDLEAVASVEASIVLYVAYYRMEEMKAFYAAMVPLVTEAAAMIVLVGLLMTTEKPV